SAPAASTPLSSAPAPEQRAVNHATFAVLEHALVATGSSGINSEDFDSAGIGIHAKGTISHAEVDVVTCKFLQSICHVHVSLVRAILCAQDQVLSIVPIGKHCGRDQYHG